MRLRLGQPVHATDGDFGEVGDIVVDPVGRSVTHLVVEPRHQHYQARLVPIGLVTVENDIVEVQLDTERLRHLQEVSDREFTHLGEPIEVGPEWDIGTEDVVATPSTPEFDMWAYDDHVTITFDRIPKGESEIRSSSAVCTSDDHRVGTVEGFVTDGDQLAGVVVRTGRRGLRHYVVIPMKSVAKVRNDLIRLSLDDHAFQALPVADDALGPNDPPSSLARIEHRAWQAVRPIEKLWSRLGRRGGPSA